MNRLDMAREEIITHCLASKHTEPYELMLELMKLPTVAMHGPEHHLLLTAALLTALCNVKGRSDLASLLEEANNRSLEVPGGACGMWGICGAAIGAGIFSSIILKSSPLAKNEWQSSGQLTAKCANAISQQGGPRCCKRDSYTAILEAIPYCNEQFNANFTIPNIVCQFFAGNKDCKTKECRFFCKTRQKIAFICVHNSCRSQIAEALCKHLAADSFKSYSAGTEIKSKINPDAIRLMKELYGIDMEQTQHPKLLTEIPPVDIVVTMGCDVSCPTLPCEYREDWALEDPTGKSDEDFICIIKQIEERVLSL